MKPFTSEVTGTPVPDADGDFLPIAGTQPVAICPHGRPSVQTCPHCLGLNTGLYTPTLGKDSPNLKFYVEQVKAAFDNLLDQDQYERELHVRNLLDYLQPFYEN
jgi:hypothetical protein